MKWVMYSMVSILIGMITNIALKFPLLVNCSVPVFKKLNVNLNKPTYIIITSPPKIYFGKPSKNTLKLMFIFAPTLYPLSFCRNHSQGTIK